MSIVSFAILSMCSLHTMGMFRGISLDVVAQARIGKKPTCLVEHLSGLLLLTPFCHPSVTGVIEDC